MLRHHPIVLTAAIAFSTPLLAGAQADHSQELLRIEDAWRKARVDGNIQFLKDLYAPELQIHGTDGSVIDRDTDIARFATGDIRPAFIKGEDLKVTLLGDIALVTGVDHLSGTYQGVTREGRVRFIHVYARRNERWLLIASQGTWLQEGRP